MISRSSFFGYSFCQGLCIEDSKYDPSDGIIIELIAKPLKSKSLIPPTSRGLSMTHKSSMPKLILPPPYPQQGDQKRMKSSESLQPKKKLNLSHLNLKQPNYHIDLTQIQNTKEEGSTKMYVSVNTSNYDQNHPLNQKRLTSEYNTKKSTKLKLKVPNPLLENQQRQVKLRIHRLGGKNNHKQNQMINQSDYFTPITASTPTSPSKKRTFLDLNLLRSKRYNKTKSFF